jgi:hypothetical protein
MASLTRLLASIVLTTIANGIDVLVCWSLRLDEKEKRWKSLVICRAFCITRSAGLDASLVQTQLALHGYSEPATRKEKYFLWIVPLEVHVTGIENVEFFSLHFYLSMVSVSILHCTLRYRRWVLVCKKTIDARHLNIPCGWCL